MIILSNALPKTASTLLASYQQRIITASKMRNGQEVLNSQFSGRYISHPSQQVLFNLFWINLTDGSFVVKCHWRPSRSLALYCRLPGVRMTMAYRDPRDIILSMIDHGRRTRNSKNPSGAFHECFDVIELIPQTLQLMKQLQAWQSQKYVHCVRYEDMMSNPLKVLKEMVAFFGWQIDDVVLQEIIESFERTKKTSHNFNKGTTERWRVEMTQREQDACLNAFKPHLSRLSYDLT